MARSESNGTPFGLPAVGGKNKYPTTAGVVEIGIVRQDQSAARATKRDSGLRALTGAQARGRPFRKQQLDRESAVVNLRKNPTHPHRVVAIAEAHRTLLTNGDPRQKVPINLGPQ